jgi:hypothetical protein
MLITHPVQLKSILNGRVIQSVSELEHIIKGVQQFRNSSGLAYFENYRGESRINYKLRPELSRLISDPLKLQEAEGRILQAFHDEVVLIWPDLFEVSQFVTGQPEFELKWKEYFQSRHLGLKTRLLDWTADWRMALLFAVNNALYFGQDGQFWIFLCPRENRYNEPRQLEYLSRDPASIEGLNLINNPIYLDGSHFNKLAQKRQARQQGKFSVQPFSQSIIPINEQDIFSEYIIRLIIDGDSKQKIKAELIAGGLSLEWALFEINPEMESVIDGINDRIIESFR